MKISVIMPAKNRESLIKEAINSVLDQTFKDFELIVIDDHSDDDTIGVVREIDDPRIKVLNLVDGTGPGAGRDFGIRNSSGEIMVMADSDDINHKDRFGKTIQAFEGNNCDVVYGCVEVFNSISGESKVRPAQEFNFELLKKINFIPTPATAFKKEAYLESGGFNLELKTSEDYDLWLSLAEKNKKFCFIDEPLVKMVVHEQSTTKTIDYDQRKNNLSAIRRKHSLEIPTFEQTKSLITRADLLEIFSTKHQKEFWFEA